MEAAELNSKEDLAAQTTLSGDPMDTAQLPVETSADISAFANALPSPELELLSHRAGVDALSLTDNQIVEALFQMR